MMVRGEGAGNQAPQVAARLLCRGLASCPKRGAPCTPRFGRHLLHLLLLAMPHRAPPSWATGPIDPRLTPAIVAAAAELIAHSSVGTRATTGVRNAIAAAKDAGRWRWHVRGRWRPHAPAGGWEARRLQLRRCREQLPDYTSAEFDAAHWPQAAQTSGAQHRNPSEANAPKPLSSPGG